MSFSKLTTEQIIQRIEQFKDRLETLGHITEEIKDHVSRATLETHLKIYKQSLDDLHKELAQRQRQGSPARL